MTIMVALLLAFMAYAQPPGQGPKGPGGPLEHGPRFEMQDPARIAMDQTDRLDRLVKLSPQQYRKIYRFNKQQARQMQNSMDSRRPMEDRAVDAAKNHQKRVKKYSRVLTPEQFLKWESFEAQREFGQIRERPR